MKKKTLAAFAAFLVIAIGISAVYLLGGEPSAPIEPAASVAQPEEPASPAAEDLAAANAEQAKEIDRLRQEVERLSSEPKEETSSPPPEAAAPAPSEAIPVSAPPAPDPISAPPAAADNPSPPPVSTPPENAGTVFEGYTVTVTDSKTPAVRSAGNDWPITKYYFIAENGNYLGSISGKAMNAIIEKYQDKSTGEAPGAGGEWEFWFAEKFNAYRGVAGDSSGNFTEKGNQQGDSTNSYKTDTNFDASSLALEAFALINQERVKAGLEEVEMDSTWMDLAEMRSEELPEKYDHVRPDGTRMSAEYRCAEIINRRASTASSAVSSWMDSSGHKDIILADKYNYAGIGCYQGEDGTVYWCMLFSK